MQTSKLFQKKLGKKIINIFTRSQSINIFITLLALSAIFSFFSDAFLSVANFNNILVQSSMTIITAVGMMFVISMGGIDISVGSVIALTGVIMGKAVGAGFSGSMAIIIGLLAGASIGSVNGFFCWKIKCTPIYHYVCYGGNC